MPSGSLTSASGSTTVPADDLRRRAHRSLTPANGVSQRTYGSRRPGSTNDSSSYSFGDGAEVLAGGFVKA
jgi:hypothetical protein